MDAREAIELIRGAIPGGAGTWADLGCGDGTFTRALAELLGRGSRIYAVDRDAKAIAALKRAASPEVIPVVADFTSAFDALGITEPALDGMLFANALHFVRESEGLLARLVERLRPGGRMVFVEYDQRAASRWVPYPIPVPRLQALATSAGLSPPVITARRPSAFGGELYASFAERPVDA